MPEKTTRVAISAANVHTSKGKMLKADRVTLPESEAQVLISRGQADEVNPVPGEAEIQRAMEVEVEVPEK